MKDNQGLGAWVTDLHEQNKRHINTVADLALQNQLDIKEAKLDRAGIKWSIAVLLALEVLHIVYHFAW